MGRHRSYAHIGRGRLRVPVALGVSTALIVIAAVTVRIVSANAAGCSGGIALRVVATPEVAPVLADIGTDWMSTGPEVGGHCVNLTVESTASATVAARTLATWQARQVASEASGVKTTTPRPAA